MGLLGHFLWFSSLICMSENMLLPKCSVFSLTHTPTHPPTHTHTHTYARTYARMHTHMHTHTQTCTHACAHTHTHAHVHTHTHAHTHPHTPTHTHATVTQYIHCVFPNMVGTQPAAFHKQTEYYYLMLYTPCIGYTQHGDNSLQTHGVINYSHWVVYVTKCAWGHTLPVHTHPQQSVAV